MPCLVTNDKTYLGQDNIDKFDALIFKIRYFRSDDRGNYDYDTMKEKKALHK